MKGDIMARFIARAKGAEAHCTRIGGASTGVSASVSGWGIGAAISMKIDPEHGDTVTVSLTGGSDMKQDVIRLGSYYIDKDNKFKMIRL